MLYGSRYRVTLTDQQRQELNRRAHQRDIAPSTRDRLEMVRLCDAGWRIPQIARPLGQHHQTVRYGPCATGLKPSWHRAWMVSPSRRVVAPPRL